MFSNSRLKGQLMQFAASLIMGAAGLAFVAHLIQSLMSAVAV